MTVYSGSIKIYANASHVIVVSGSRSLAVEKNNNSRLVISDNPPSFNQSHLTEGVIIFGFLKLSLGYYCLAVSKASNIGWLADSHLVQSIDDMDMIPLFDEKAFPRERRHEESNLLKIMHSNPPWQGCIFSLTTDLSKRSGANYQDPRFVWNSLHAEALPLDWYVPVIQGSFVIKKFLCRRAGRIAEVALIARRSQLYAGTRYRKRGFDSNGNCANEVEIEQFVRLVGYPEDTIATFTQLRASVPLYWRQEPDGLLPKPKIEYFKPDISFSTTQKHIRNLTDRYRGRVVLVNTLKRSDETESELSRRMETAIYGSDQVELRHFDVKEESEESIKKEAEGVIGSISWDPLKSEQCGVIRTNCLDCLDRTNLFQASVGLAVLKRVFNAWGFGSDELHHTIVSGFTNMYKELGDCVALQYAGSEAQSEPRKSPTGRFILSMKRQYQNSFVDHEKQHAINMFFSLYESVGRIPTKLDAEIDHFAHKKRVQGVCLRSASIKRSTNEGQYEFLSDRVGRLEKVLFMAGGRSVSLKR